MLPILLNKAKDLYSCLSNYIVGNTTMISQAQLEVLASFFPRLDEKASREIEVSTGLSHEPVFRILKELVKNRHLKERKVGKTNVYEFVLTDDAFLIYNYFMAKRMEKFRSKHGLLYKRLREFAASLKADSVILFGSYSKGREIKDSDIDILVVSDEKGIENKAMAFRTKYSLLIKPITVKNEDFDNIRKDNPAFYEDIVEFGIILEGIEFFFKRIYQNEKNA